MSEKDLDWIAYNGITEEEINDLNDLRRRIARGEVTSVDGRKVPQVKFNTLIEFRKGANNFYTHFLKHATGTRESPYYQEFMKKYSDLERELTEEVTNNEGFFEDLPWEKLLKAYNFMAELVKADYTLRPPICYDDTKKVFL